jgi:serine/threonine protein kinase/tetratricopeptide (TPR) repeat protein
MADDMTRLAGDSDPETIVGAGEQATILSVPDSGRAGGGANAAPPTLGGDYPTILQGPPPVAAGSATVAPGTVGGAADSGPLKAGQAFGKRYHIIRPLGLGGMGAVYQAWDAELGVAVAIKVIRPEVMADPTTAAEVARRFKRELLLARQVTHKNVVRIHDLGEMDGVKYITMTYVDGADLASQLKHEGRLPVRAVMRIARQVVSGLVEAHKAGVVHRDLKPANIMIDKSGEALIMDFGIARSSGGAGGAASEGFESLPPGVRSAVIEGATRYGAVVGTVEYMAPEQAKGQDVDQRADIYAFGLMLYDMLVGREHRAQHTDSAIAELRARMEHEPPPAKSVVPELPDAVDQLISRCLQPDPANRYQTTEELAAVLNRLDDDGAPIPEPRRFTPRMIAAGVVLVLALVAGTWWLTHTPPTQQHEPVTVVIADFQNNTNDPTFDRTLEQTLRRALEDASFISAFDRSKLPNAGVVRVPEKLDEVAARELAVKQGLGVVLAGSISPYGNGYEISVKATQTVTGKQIVSTSSRASSKDTVLETAAKLMARVRKVLGDRTSESDQLFAMRSVSASSLEVVNYYAAGVEAQARGKFEDARKNLLLAVEKDPNFGLGYQGLAAMSATLGRRDEAQKYIEEALRHVDGLTARERLFTRGAYYRLMGDYRNCAKEYGELISRYPADNVARVTRAACLVFLRQIPEALAETQRAVKAMPNHVAFRMNLVLTAYRAGEFQLVEDEVKAVEQPDPRVILALAYSQMGRGMPHEAESTYQRVAAMDPRHPYPRQGLADVLVYEGRFSEAVRILEEAAAADVAAKKSLPAAIKFLSAGNAHLQRGQLGLAATSAEKALQQSTAMAVRFLAAQIFVETGAIDKAQALAAALAKSTDAGDDSRVYGKIIDAQIALKKKDPHQAIKILTDANNVLDTWLGHFNLGRAYLEDGKLVEADSEFDLCIARRGEALTVMDEGPSYGIFPSVYYYQGRVREGLKTANFADSYREYLNIRGQSQEDPLVPEVRKRAGN